jgi:hypothetical protein
VLDACFSLLGSFVVLFSYLLYVLLLIVDLVPVATESPVDADSEQYFEEEEELFEDQGKWPSPHILLIPDNCMITKIYL